MCVRGYVCNAASVGVWHIISCGYMKICVRGYVCNAACVGVWFCVCVDVDVCLYKDGFSLYIGLNWVGGCWFYLVIR